MNFYSPNEKIRLMRKRFNMNQAELEDSNMTRAFISMMESGKRNVSKASSKLLANKFNLKAESLDVELNLDEEYFFRKPKEDARIYCKGQLLKKLSHEELEEIIKIANEFQLEEIIAEAYMKNADNYFDKSQYSDAFMNYSNALGKFKELKDSKDQAYIYNSMGICKAKRSEYEEAVFYYNQAIYYALEVNDDLRFVRASYNLAVAYFYMQQYEKSIEVLDKDILNNNIKAEHLQIINSEVTRANSLYQLNRIKEAIDASLNIIEKIGHEDDTLLSTLYNNLGEYYYELGNFEKSLEYIGYAQKLKNKVSKKTLPHVLNTKGKVFFKQGFYYESIMIFELAIDIAIEYNNFSTLLENYKDLIKAYETKDNLIKIKESAESLLESLEENNIEEGKNYAITKLIEIDIKLGKCDEAISLLHKLETLIIKE